MRPVATTSAAVRPDGGTKKSLALVAVPNGVPTLILPELAFAGTAVCSCVAVAEVAPANVALNTTLSFDDVGSKLAPVTATAVPATPMVGEKLVIVGGAPMAPTMKSVRLVAVFAP